MRLRVVRLTDLQFGAVEAGVIGGQLGGSDFSRGVNVVAGVKMLDAEYITKCK